VFVSEFAKFRVRTHWCKRGIGVDHHVELVAKVGEFRTNVPLLMVVLPV